MILFCSENKCFPQIIFLFPPSILISVMKIWLNKNWLDRLIKQLLETYLCSAYIYSFSDFLSLPETEVYPKNLMKLERLTWNLLCSAVLWVRLQPLNSALYCLRCTDCSICIKLLIPDFLASVLQLFLYT